MRANILLIACGLLTAFVSAAPAFAGDLVVDVRTPAGLPVVDAVVSVQPAGGGAAPSHYAQPLRMAQHNRMFEPFVLVVPVGAEVAFPNQDAFRHQVYSFSPVKKFELKLYGRDESRVVKFDKPGVVAVGCNIHDSMAAFIKVIDTPFAATTDAAGHVVLKGLPAGSAVVKVWHPYAKAPQDEQRLDLVVPRDGAVQRAVSADLRPMPKMNTGS